MALEAGFRTVRAEYDVVRGGTKYTELRAVGAPEVSMTANAESKLAFSGAFCANPLFNPLHDRIRPYLVLDGTRYPLGKYVVTSSPARYENGAEKISVECTDEAAVLKDSKTTEHVMFAKNNRYTDIVQAILIENGLTSILCTASDARLQTDREDWEIGTPYLTIANALLAEINYNSLWFDLDGYARIAPYQPPSVQTLRPDHSYRSGALSIIKADCGIENDLISKPNVFIATVSNPDYPEPLRATAINDNPQSPLSVTARGRKIVAVYRPDNIASQAALQDFVENERYKSLIASESVTVQTALNPVHLVGDTFALEHERLRGVFAETEWRMTLEAGGSMTHTGKRVLYLD